MSQEITDRESILGLGIDLVDIDRIASAWDRHGSAFLERIYTPEEQAYCLKQKQPLPSLAARFALKEAASKAFGTGIGAELGWKSISVGKLPSEAPYAILDPQAQALLEKMGAKRLLISLTHTKTLAQAIALLVS